MNADFVRGLEAIHQAPSSAGTLACALIVENNRVVGIGGCLPAGSG
jgi:hypothetical protein